MRENKLFIKDGQVYEVRKIVGDVAIVTNLSSNKFNWSRVSLNELANVTKWFM